MVVTVSLPFSVFFNSKMTVTEQFWSYGFMAYIAENRGFVGLFLGYSLLQLEELIIFCSKKFQSEEKEERTNSGVSPSSAYPAEMEKEVFDLVFDLEKTARDIPDKKRKRKTEKK